jgi:hypothetical protein
VVFVLLAGTLLALNGKEAHFEHIDSVAEEDCFPACDVVSANSG